MNYPRVGVAAIVQRNGQVLLIKRKGAHGSGSWAVPGGHLEYGESLEECAVRETHEEVGIEISDVSFAAITNDIFLGCGKALHHHLDAGDMRDRQAEHCGGR